MTITVGQFLELGQSQLQLRVIVGEAHLDRPIRECALNRPGLAFAGFFKHFANRRIQVLGRGEQAYLEGLPAKERARRMQAFFRHRIPCVVLTSGRPIIPELKRIAAAARIPVLVTSLVSSQFINKATVLLENLSCPRKRYQGTMVSVQGVGILMEGRDGVGKSETALALIERGHSLVADDVTVLRRDSAGVIYGAAVPITRYHMEIRGLGIIHVPSLFGVGSMLRETKLDLIVHLHRPDPAIEDDRTGISQKTRDVLGVKIPLITLPVIAGRDLAHVVEVAARNQKLRQLGHDAAKELDEKMVSILTGKTERQAVD